MVCEAGFYNAFYYFGYAVLCSGSDRADNTPSRRASSEGLLAPAMPWNMAGAVVVGAVVVVSDWCSCETVLATSWLGRV